MAVALKKAFLLILCLCPVFSQAQMAIVQGYITDTTGKALNNVRVTASDINFEDNVSTNRKGFYSIKIPGNRVVNLEFGGNLGYASKTKNMKLSPGEVRPYNVTLEIENESDVVIRGNIFDLTPLPPPGYRGASITNNFEDFLKYTQLGVTSNSELSSTYNVRGGNYDENLIYVNDIEIYRPFLVRAGQQEGLSFIHSDLIDNIQFSGGGFDAKYGDKLSSVLDIKYKKPTDKHGSIMVNGMGAHGHFEGRSANRRFTYLLGARYRNNSYILNSLQTQGDYKPVFADAQTLLSYYLKEDLKIEFLGHFSSNKFRVIPENRETAFGPINEALKFTVYFDGQEVTQFNTYTGALSLTYDLSEDSKIKFITSSFRSIETEKFDIQGQYWLDELETDLGSEEFGQTTFNRGVGTFLNHARNELDAQIYNAYVKGESIKGQHRILYGAKYQHEIFDDKISEWSMLDSAGYSIPAGDDETIVLDNLVKAKLGIQSNRYSAYIQDVYTKVMHKDTMLNGELVYSPAFLRVAYGVRAQYWDYNGQAVISPRAKMSYTPRWYYQRGDSTIRRDAEIRFATGVYYQPPFYRELRTFDGSLNPEVRAQKSIHFVFGGHYTFDMWDRPFKFTSEVYYKILRDINPYEIDNVRIRYHAENKAKGYAAGIDFQINGEFVEGIESYAKLSFLKTEEDIVDDFYYDYFNSEGEKIIFGYTQNDAPVDSVRMEPGRIARPADQRVTFGLYFQDQMPKWPSYKVNLSILFGTALPYGPPDHDRYKDVFRTPAYRRVDIGFSKDLLTNRDRLKKDSFWHNVKDMWISLEVFNLLNINNTISYTWIKDVNNLTYPVPNYLTGRRLNLKFVCKF